MESAFEPDALAFRWSYRRTRASRISSASDCSSEGVFLGSPLDPLRLLLTGAALWAVNVAMFALAYWELDGGGPEAR